MLRMRILTTALILTTTVNAQDVYVPDNNPAVGACNVIPFGHNTVSTTWSNQRYQCMITTADMGASTSVANICDLGFAPCVAGIRHFDTIEIVMAQTTAGTLSTTFATNLATLPSVVLRAKGWDWHNDLANVWTRIGLDKSYLYLQANGNLVIQITVTGAVLHTSSTAFPGYRRGDRQRIYNFGWTGTPPTTGTSSPLAASKIELVIGTSDLNDFGLGCKGTAGIPDLHLSGSATIGTGSIGMTVTNCPASNLVLHVFGLARYEPAIDLGFAGAPGCTLYETVDIVLPGVTNASGVYSLKAKVPNDRALICLRIYTQVFPNDPNANSWGRTASNFGRILPGL